MAKLEWDKTGERYYETGVDHAVLFVQKTDGTYDKGVAWNGISSVSESPSGAESNAVYADNIKYLDLISKEDFGATVEAYTYPDEWEICDGSASPSTGVTLGQQARRAFGLCYRTKIGNDVANDDYGYKIHLIYNCKAAPSERSYQTINDSPEAITFSWEITTTPVNVTGYKPCSNITIDSTKVDATKLASFLDIIYGKDPTTQGGDDGTDPRLPSPDDVIKHFATESTDGETVIVDGETNGETNGETTGEG